MNKTIALSLTIVLVAGLIGFYIYSLNTRYYIQPMSKGIAYKIDRKTGKTWIIAFGKETLIKGSCQENDKRSPDEKAIELAQNSHVLGAYVTADAQIKSWLQNKKGYLKIYGWKARKIDEQTYLVSYTFDEGKGKGKVGYFFEVNIKADIVRKISGDPVLEKRYRVYYSLK